MTADWISGLCTSVDAGAIGQIHTSPHEHVHEMCVSPVRGRPAQATDALAACWEAV